MSDLASTTTQDNNEVSTKKDLIPQFGLITGLLIVIVVACVMVLISYLLYINNPQYKYDLARPDVKNSNPALEAKQNELSDTTSLVDAPSIKRKIDFLNKELISIESINSFGEKEVTDQALQLDTDIAPLF